MADAVRPTRDSVCDLILIKTADGTLSTSTTVIFKNRGMTDRMTTMRLSGRPHMDLTGYDTEAVFPWIQWASAGSIDAPKTLHDALKLYVFAKDINDEALCQHVMVEVIRPYFDRTSTMKLGSRHVTLINQAFEPEAEIYIRMIIRLCKQASQAYMRRSEALAFTDLLPQRVVQRMYLYQQGYGPMLYDSGAQVSPALNGFGSRTAMP